jgi:hypothetical protein
MELESNLKNAYLQAYKMACNKLIHMDAEEISLNTNAYYDKERNVLCVKYFNADYVVNSLTGDVAKKSSQEEVTTTEKVLILHYLINSKIKPLTGNLISFKDMKGGGAIYYQTFYKRAIIPLVKTFGDDPQRLYRAADKLSGIRERYGNASVTINVFPLVPITYVVWQGDEEVPSSGTILFDESITNFLPDEDIVLAASFGTYELMKLARD